MAALPLEAFTEEDPPVEDPAFYYPPGTLVYLEIYISLKCQLHGCSVMLLCLIVPCKLCYP